jgi:hypothetical protein
MSGSVSLRLDPAAAGATDSAIAFASGGQTTAFTVGAGASQAQFGGASSAAFQTGTTAGTLVFTIDFGGATSRQSVTVPAVPVGITAIAGARQAAGVSLQLTGFDNTRTAGKLVFTFYDAGGNAIAPGAITADSTSSFTGWFENSTLGGVFALTAVFPVTGTVSQVASFEVQLINSAGTTRTPRTNF